VLLFTDELLVDGEEVLLEFLSVWSLSFWKSRGKCGALEDLDSAKY